ncbi:hypothetical protein HU230_0012475 [Bradyrhizobium quebecense]|uniref:Uncharacterized protein n=2 Tax=Bradyrhizobium quebecense TaxID=2748629 RepID=A0A973WRA2_9BRAD|nr:hypothetical protein [Bradyrhizobium quebecense]UGA46804.1 hypothetical protein HU230_0012475 [Bradyrhizobium quebecense]
MEKSITATIGNLYTSGLAVPGDLLQLIAITDETDPLNVTELTRVSLPEVLRILNDNTSCGARAYTRRGSKFLIAPMPTTGSVIRMDYYATFQPLSAPTDTNVLGDIAPDCIVYGALSYAAAYFLDKRQSDFEARFKQIVDDLNGQAMSDELTGAAQVSNTIAASYTDW